MGARLLLHKIKTDNRPRSLFLGGYLYDKGENDERFYVVSREAVLPQPIYKYILTRLCENVIVFILKKIKLFFCIISIKKCYFLTF